MKTLMIIAVMAFLAGCAGRRTNRPPEHMMIEMAFFKCEKCQSLEGGIYGKGPFKSFRSPQGKTCVHNWRRITKEEFKTLGTEWMEIDWTKEIPFWNRKRQTESPEPSAGGYRRGSRASVLTLAQGKLFGVLKLTNNTNERKQNNEHGLAFAMERHPAV